MPRQNPSVQAQLFELRQLVAPGVTIANPDAHGWCALLRHGRYHEGRVNLTCPQIEMEYSDYVEDDVADNEDLWAVMALLGIDGMDWEGRGWSLPDCVEPWVTDNEEHGVSVTFSRSADDFSALLEEFKWVFGLIKSPHHHADPQFSGLNVTSRSDVLLEEAGYTEEEISRMSGLERTLAIEHHHGPDALRPARPAEDRKPTIHFVTQDLTDRLTELGWSAEQQEKLSGLASCRVAKANLSPAGLTIDEAGRVIPESDSNVTPLHWPEWLRHPETDP